MAAMTAAQLRRAAGRARSRCLVLGTSGMMEARGRGQAERRAQSFTALDQRILDCFYWWSVINVFIGAMLGGSIFSQFRVVLKDPGVPGTPSPQLVSSRHPENNIATRRFPEVSPFPLPRTRAAQKISDRS